MKAFRFLVPAVAGYVCLAQSLGAAVRVVGSDLLGEVLKPGIEAEAERRGWDLETDFTGTLTAAAALEAGEAELAILALPKDNPPTDGFLSFPLGFEVTSVVVNELNPVTELSVPDLRTLFALRPKGESSTWAEAGAEGSWAARQMSFHAVRDRDHLNLELFRSLVLGPREMRLDVDYQTTKALVIDTVATDSNSIGLIPVDEEHPQVRVLFISLGEGGQAYGPTPQSVFYGDYPLRLAYYLVYPEDASNEVLEVVRFLFGDSMAELMSESDYMPTPETERRQFQMDLDFGG